jgi:DNA-binding SARP family transcriptional activator/TolB-like protein/cytochrome c-type biogenesis protein CcmH/NrfG
MTEVSARTARICVLGPVDCTTDQPSSLGGPKQRLLLALLVAHEGQVVTVGVLVDAVWGERPPDDARHTLQVFVSRLRNALRPLGGTVRWKESGYVLTVPPYSVDAQRFEQLVLDAARSAGTVEDRARHRALLEEALSLWRGRPFGELGDHPALMAESERLTELKLRATEALIDLDLATGRHEVSVAELRRLAAQHPLAESLCARLMLALHRCGRRPEALTVFEQMRRTLSEELGVDPSRPLQRLHLLLLDDSPRLGALVPGDLDGVDLEPALHQQVLEHNSRSLRREGPAAPGIADVSRPPPETSSVAVMPFDVLGSGEDATVLAAGLHAELLVELARVRGLTVIGRFSVVGYAGTARPLRQIAAELGVCTVVTGSLQVLEGRFRLAVELVEATDGRHRWAESYDVALHPRNVFTVQHNLAQDLAAALSRSLSSEQPPTTHSLEVYRLVAEGRLQFDRKTEEGFARAVHMFRRAVALDPHYLPGWLGLAESLALMADYAYGDRADLLDAAESAVNRCLALKPGSPEAHVALGLVAEARFDAPAALAEYAHVLRHVPGHADGHSWTAWMSLTVGEIDAALPAARRAVQLNPLSTEAVSNLALALLAAGDPVSGHAEALRAAALSPGYTTAEYYAGMALYDQGRFEEAVETLVPLATAPRGVLSTAWAGQGPDTALALSLIAVGDVAAGLEVLATIDPGTHPVEAGLVHLALGDTGLATALLDGPVPAGYGSAMLFHLHFRDVWGRLDDDYRAALGVRIRSSWHVPPGWRPLRR